MNLWDILILTLVAAAVLFAVRAIRRGRTGGCHGCSGSCDACERSCDKKP